MHHPVTLFRVSDVPYCTLQYITDRIWLFCRGSGGAARGYPETTGPNRRATEGISTKLAIYDLVTRPRVDGWSRHTGVDITR